MKKIFLLLISVLFWTSCSKEEDYSNLLPGFWELDSEYVDGELADSESVKMPSIFIESNGIYRMFEPNLGIEHSGTWILTDTDWLSMSIDKVVGKNTSDGSYRYNQVLVRFTLLSISDEFMEIRIKTFLEERKKLIMFSQLKEDPIPQTPDEEIALDNENKKLHTYIYRFKKVKK